MKKLILITSLVGIFASSSAVAKTEGSTASLDVVGSRAHIRFIDSNNDQFFKNRANGGLGLTYKYAYNFDKAFIRPGVFVEKNNVEYQIPNSSSNPAVKIDNRYGFKADVGYDIDEKISLYVVGGLSFLNYEVSNSVGKTSSKSKSDVFYGIGATFDHSETVAFGLEYNTQEFSLNQAGGNDVVIDLDVFKLSMIYKF